MSKFTTANGKDVATFRDPKTTQIRIKFVQGGELPEQLSGLFTSEYMADKAIFSYIEQNKVEEDPKVRRQYNKKEA